MDWKTLIAVLIYMGCGAAGDLMLSHGMRQMGPFEGLHASGVLRFLQHVITTPIVLGGIALLILGFAAFLALLTWADLSVVVPSGAGSYLFIVLLSRWVLHEEVPPRRWLGVVLVTIGIALVLSSHPASAVGEGDGSSYAEQLARSFTD